MRDKYYSDDRDLVKWATLCHIALESELRTILRGEWLILYQHARHTIDWSESVAKELSSFCNGTKANIVRSDDESI